MDEQLKVKDIMTRQAPSKSLLKKFEAIKFSVQQETAFLLNEDFSGMSPEYVANTAIYRATDSIIREKLNDEQNAKLDKMNEVQYVLEALKEEVGNGRITKAELAIILESKEFNDYAAVE
ncbi:MAG: hypothetical protein HY001_02095 [Candidatus Portnoybacteria bacterium]|nr:hypothetical protein [Candidatus Portnoybacteria bacterium]